MFPNSSTGSTRGKALRCWRNNPWRSMSLSRASTAGRRWRRQVRQPDGWRPPEGGPDAGPTRRPNQQPSEYGQRLRARSPQVFRCAGPAPDQDAQGQGRAPENRNVRVDGVAGGEKFRQNGRSNIPIYQRGMVTDDFSLCTLKRAATAVCAGMNCRGARVKR